MLAVVSPAKKLDFETEIPLGDFTQPDFMEETEELVQQARKLSRQDLASMMHISDKLADLNFQRFRDFHPPFDLGNAKQAALVFNGDTYIGLKARNLSDDDLHYAQDHLRILSGLYGILRPLDLIQPYRLEMGSKFRVNGSNNLYEFWGGQLAEAVNDAVAGHKDKTLINLASNEYFKAIDRETLTAPVITPVFKEVKQGVAKVLGMFAKRARGAMARYMIVKRIDTPDGLKDFNEDGYEFRPDLSDQDTWVYTRERD